MTILCSRFGVLGAVADRAVAEYQVLSCWVRRLSAECGGGGWLGRHQELTQHPARRHRTQNPRTQNPSTR